MEELQAIFKWLLMVFMLSTLMRPYLRIRNLKFWDRGFSLSFGLGTAISFFFCWIISALGVADFDTFWVILSVIIVTIFGTIMSTALVKNKITLSVLFDKKADYARYLLGFLVFAIVFLLGIYVKGFKPEITSTTEQYMDYGFVKSIYRQQVAFPEDIWYAGENLNYYFLGQAVTVFLCRLSFVGPEWGYPFMLYTIEASLFTMVLSLSASMIRGKRTGKILGGLAASFMACFAGNGHYLIYGVIVPLYEKITGNISLRYAQYGYFFSDSTTYIGYDQAVEDFGKHEFPAYSFILGDLHAHVINLIFVIPLLALLFDYAFDNASAKSTNQVNYKTRIFTLFDVRLFLISVFFAVFMGSNYWDFPIYFVICGGVILFSDFHKEGLKWSVFLRVLIKGALMLGMSFLLAAPFNMHFTKMASEIHFCDNHSPIYKLIILWIIPVGICVWFLIYLIKKNLISKKSDSDFEQRKTILMIAFVSCAIGLIILPEIIYVKDIYGESYARFNTMFKLTYQSFVLTAIVIGAAVGTWIEDRKSLRGVILLSAILLLSSYTGVGIAQFMGSIFDIDNRRSCNSYDFIYDDIDIEPQMNAIEIINNDTRKRVHILETGGTSYQPDNMISVFTGAPTYVGWGVHEWMWRGEWDPIGRRQGEVAFFYESGQNDYCSQFLTNQTIDYIWVGPREQMNYEIDYSGFENLPEVTLEYESEDHKYRLYSVSR